MTYRKLIDLKYGQGISTYELMRRYPQDIKRVSEIALLDIPEDILQEVIDEERLFQRLLFLKKKFLMPFFNHR